MCFVLDVTQVDFPQTNMTPYPDWVFGVIVLLSVLPVIPIPLVALYTLICCGLGRRRMPCEPGPSPCVAE